VLLATDVAARGLDVKGVEYVVHYQLPRSAEVYVHRSGRTARAAAAGLCVSLVEPSSSRAFRKLCHELSVPQGLDEYPMPPKTLAAALEAAKLAQKVDKAEHKNSRAAKQASSMRRMAEEMDLPVSSDDEEEEETRHSNGRQQAREAALVARQRDDLRRMLGKLGWPAGGAAAS
jgi:ATP-dependent RNA helicase DDX24/MAK5